MGRVLAFPGTRARRRARLCLGAGVSLVAGALLGLAAAGWNPNLAEASPAASPAASLDAEHSAIGFCGSGPRRNCVVDGDTFWLAGEKIRIADIDTPETHPPRCDYEAELGERAARRLHALLNDGPFELEPIDRDTDRYGRKLRIVTRAGRSLGDTLVAEGLARTWTGRREPWCV